ncbi:two-component system sensor histidine kinase PhoR [Alginatibacterium sediminis]|uniref:Phosphate regulon sensor protein PhoR n=1 Tax=Alginatibacterium sediminis TaxID=2164068 RepID=A0A420E9V8_9ALTE|nr:phosphate regulon sensor histidine kinase PhoR [Alginatibacterium sediminis]RKF17459.1 two-component system sensor histidine kinase PhoR [Alginatibacterium sediminis]
MNVAFSALNIIQRALRWYIPLAIIGLISGYMLEVLFAASIVHILYLYRQQALLMRWLYKDKRLTPPVGSGSWELVFHGIYNLMKRRLQRERELAQLLKYFKLGAQALPDALVVLRSDGAILWCNQLASELLGLKWPSDSGQRLVNLVRDPKFVTYIDRRNYAKPLEIPSPVNPNLTLEFRIEPYSEQQFLVVVRDVSEVRRLENMRTQFVSNVSHELRTPLTVMRGYLEMLEPNSVNPAIWPRAHRTLTEQSKRMESLVNQLLTLARIESGSQFANHELIPVSELLSLLSDQCDSLICERELKLSYDVDEGLEVFGNREQLLSAILNLSSNAIKYCETPGEILISWSQTDTGSEFLVRDSGPGIEPVHLGRLTERFYRVDDARTRDAGGTGLGLSIVKHILAEHNSVLEIESTVGFGSCFSFELKKPVAEYKESSTDLPIR